MTYHTGTVGKYQSKKNRGIYVRSCAFNNVDKERLAKVLTHRTGEDMSRQHGQILTEILLEEVDKMNPPPWIEVDEVEE
jgi:uncharacterized pyridoxal phosphate-containing UPF0001 family protein